MSKFFNILFLALTLVFTSCSKDLVVENDDLRDSVVGRWMAMDDVVGKTVNERVVTIFRVEGSQDEVRIENLVNTNIFFTVSLDDNGQILLTPSDKNYVNFSIDESNTLVDQDHIEIGYVFEGNNKETILEKR